MKNPSLLFVFYSFILCFLKEIYEVYENKNQNKKNLRLKIYGKIRNGRLKLDPSVLIKKMYFQILYKIA